VDAILATNVVRADTLNDAPNIRLVEYHWQRKTGYVIREWSRLQEPDAQYDLFGEVPDEYLRDEVAIHYRLLGENPGPVMAETHGGRTR
jgi:hypothetical protein